MRKTFKLLIACLAIVMLTCLITACDFGGSRCRHDLVETYREEYCNERGMVYYECSKCGFVSDDKIPPVGHDIEVIKGFEPTCTDSGYTDEQVCKRCGDTVVQSEEIPARHTIAIQEEVPATCTQDGKSEGQYCTVCNTVIVPQATIYADHKFEIIPEVPATCTEDGWTEGYVCSVCGLAQVEPERIIAAHNDVIMDGMYGTPATCYSTGLTEQRICTECHTITQYQEVIPMLEHTKVLVPGYAATCTSKGLTDGYRCASCGVVFVEQKEIQITAHTATTISGYAATCTSVGLSDGEICKDCGIVMKNQYTTPGGHNFVDNKCTGCNLEVTTNLEYEELNATFSFARSGKQYVVKGLRQGTTAPEVLVIPDTYNDCPVVGIMANAFENVYDIKKVVLPKTIVEIGENAFNGCTNLKTVECADFAQPESWGNLWYGSSIDIQITAILNQGRTPYETYVEAMNETAHNYKQYVLYSYYNSYYYGNELVSTYWDPQYGYLLTSTVTNQECSGQNYIQRVTDIDYVSDSSTTTAFGYVNGYLYAMNSYNVLCANRVSYEYWLHNYTISSASITLNPEDFKRVEYYRDINGKMTLTVSLDGDRMVEIMEQMNPGQSFEGIYLSDPTYTYVFDSNGYIESYEFITTMNYYMTIKGGTEFSSINEDFNMSLSYFDGAQFGSPNECPGDHYYPVEVDQVDPTCFAEGRSAYSYCAYCGETITNMTPIDPKHKFENGECTVCGTYENANTSTGLAYALAEDKVGYVIVGLGECKDTDVYIPTQINGISVVRVNANAFNGTSVENVIIDGEIVTPIDEFGGWEKQ